MKARHLTRWAAGVVVVVLIAVAVVLATRPPSQAAQIDSPLIGKPAPAITGTAFDSARFSLSSYRGRFVLVNFFASWCPPCQSEEPNLAAFAFTQSRSPNGAALVSVDIDDTVAAGRAFVTQWGATWPAIPDHNGAIANDYGVGSPPMTFLIDPKGRIIGVWAGPATAGQLEAKLAAARKAQA